MALNKFLKSFFINLYSKINSNDIVGTAAETAFFLVLSIPPLLILLLQLIVNISLEEFNAEFLESFLPKNISAVINYVYTTLPTSTKATFISLLGILFSASGSIWALMKGIHKTHTNKPLGLNIKHRVTALFFTVIFVLTISISLSTLVINGVAEGLIERFDMLQKSRSFFKGTILPIASIYAFTHILYKFTPDIKLKGKELFCGALFTALGWLLVSNFFESYIIYFTKYTTIYGGIGAFLVLLLWLFVVSFIILLGAQINAALMEAHKQK